MCQALLEIMESEINEIKRVAVQEAQRQGMQQGIEQGMQKGMQQGKIMGSVDMLRDFGQSTDKIKEIIMRKYNLDEEEVAAYL